MEVDGAVVSTEHGKMWRVEWHGSDPAALLAKKEHTVPIGWEVGWASRAGLDTVAKRKIPVLLPGIQVWSSSP